MEGNRAPATADEGAGYFNCSIADDDSPIARLKGAREHADPWMTRTHESAQMFAFVGPVSPEDRNPGRPMLETTKARCEIRFPSDLPAGTKVWITARWINPTRQPGPASIPISTYLGGGMEMPNRLAA